MPKTEFDPKLSDFVSERGLLITTIVSKLGQVENTTGGLYRPWPRIEKMVEICVHDFLTLTPAPTPWEISGNVQRRWLM